MKSSEENEYDLKAAHITDSGYQKENSSIRSWTISGKENRYCSVSAVFVDPPYRRRLRRILGVD